MCPHLIVKSASKAYPVHIPKSLAAETIDTYSNTMTHVYTDGSALNAVEQAGYGLTIQYPDATRKDISEACGQHCNNYDAELKAIRSALQTISEDCDNPNPPCVNNIVIFTDSQSAIQAIAQMQHHKQPIVTDILTTANKLHNQNDVETSIQWIPGHCTQQSVSTAPTVMRPLNISCSTAHCTTTSDPDYCQRNQIYTTRYMDPLHNCNEQPPTTCQP